MNLAEKVQFLIGAANDATGENNTDLTGAVGALIHGYGGGINILQYCHKAPTFDIYYPSLTPVVTAPNCVSFSNIFYSARGQYTAITLASEAQVTDLASACSTYSASNTLQSLTLNITNLSKVTTYSRMIENNRSCSAIFGSPLDFSSVTNQNFSNWGRNKTNYATASDFHVRYKPNTLHVNHDLSGERTLSDASVVSIANGLQAGARTITLWDGIKTKCQNIRGAVSQVTVGGAAYDFFTAGAGGTVTLESFITQTKGWTIA